MRYTGKILTSALALSLAFQSVPALVSHAEEDFLDALVTLHGDSDIKEYDIALGVYCNEYTIPTELANGKIVGLDLAHVYVRNYMFDMKNSDSVILHIPEGVEITNKHWRGVFTGVTSITLIYASGEKEKLLCDDYEIA